MITEPDDQMVPPPYEEPSPVHEAEIAEASTSRVEETVEEHDVSLNVDKDVVTSPAEKPEGITFSDTFDSSIEYIVTKVKGNSLEKRC